MHSIDYSTLTPDRLNEIEQDLNRIGKHPRNGNDDEYTLWAACREMLSALRAPQVALPFHLASEKPIEGRALFAKVKGNPSIYYACWDGKIFTIDEGGCIQTEYRESGIQAWIYESDILSAFLTWQKGKGQ